MEETIKILEWQLKAFKKDLKEKLEAEMMSRDQANEEYRQFYHVVELLKMAKAKGVGVKELKGWVQTLPVLEKQTRLF